MNGKETWESLKRYKEEIKQGDIVVFVWHIDDVLGLAEEREIELSEDEAREILYNVRREHDCMIGINWEVISYYLDDFVYERENTA
jgi:hypothetical protein